MRINNWKIDDFFKKIIRSMENKVFSILIF